MSVRQAAQRCLHEGCAACIVEVLEARGSVPREPGTRMLVTPDAVHGTIGGGHLEWQAIARARQALQAADAHALPIEQPLALGPSLGQCCGGALTLRYRRLDAQTLADWPEEPRPHHVVLFGAGHVGRAIVRLLADLPVSVDWVDEREEEFAQMHWPAGDAPAHIRRVAVDAPQAEIDTAPPGSHLLVLTHQHDLDLRICEAALRRDDFAFLGLIGSKTKRARFEHRLRERGFADAQIARITCPIGVPGITGKQPEVIAVAVVAQLLQAMPA